MSSGGPLLCIGDLLSDVGDGEAVEIDSEIPVSVDQLPSTIQSTDLQHLFEENYNQLTAALESSDHSWTDLTLKLCTALKTADKLVKDACSSMNLLAEKVEALEKVLERENSVICEAKAVFAAPKSKYDPK